MQSLQQDAQQAEVSCIILATFRPHVVTVLDSMEVQCNMAKALARQAFKSYHSLSACQNAAESLPCSLAKCSSSSKSSHTQSHHSVLTSFQVGWWAIRQSPSTAGERQQQMRQHPSCLVCG